MPRFEEPSHWTPVLVQQHIDPILLNDKRLEISSALQEKRRSAMADAKNDYQRANTAILLADEWAEKMFAGYLEIWDLQGFPRSHALYMAIYEAIRQGFGGCSSAFVGEVNQLASVHRRTPDSSTLRSFKLGMDKLAFKWNVRINAESRRCMYAARREAQMNRGTVPNLSASQNSKQVGALATTFTSKESAGFPAQLPQPNREAKASRKAAGRKPTRNPEFVRLAGKLWKTNQDSSRRVTQQALKSIAAALDGSPFSNPSDWLERKAASDLKAHNKKFGNSPKKILSWTHIVERNEQDFKEAMRRLLSRCAGTSGN
jgi:hypothetical protein